LKERNKYTKFYKTENTDIFFKMYKIAIVGPESTGKSVLAENLALHFQGEWIPEYAREYVERLAEPYQFQDVCNIAKKQIEQEDKYSADTAPGFVFFDTDLIITKVWFQYCYKTVPDFVNAQLQRGVFDFYLLCAPDLTWEPDTVREHGQDREFFYDWYKKEIELLDKPYGIVTGAGDIRFQNAIQLIKEHINITKGNEQQNA